MGWWNAILWQMTLKDQPASGARQRLVKLLRQRYRNDWSKLARDFDPEGVSGFRELEGGGTLYLRPGGNGIHAMRDFLGVMAERYYEVVGGYGAQARSPRAHAGRSLSVFLLSRGCTRGGPARGCHFEQPQRELE